MSRLLFIALFSISTLVLVSALAAPAIGYYDTVVVGTVLGEPSGRQNIYTFTIQIDEVISAPPRAKNVYVGSKVLVHVDLGKCPNVDWPIHAGDRVEVAAMWDGDLYVASEDNYVRMVWEFTIKAESLKQYAELGESVHYKMTIEPVSGAAREVWLSVSGLPPGVGYSFDPPSGYPPFTSVLTITVPEDVEVGAYTFLITAASDGKSESIEATLVVEAPSPTPSPPTTLYVAAAAGAIAAIAGGIAGVVLLKPKPLKGIEKFLEKMKREIPVDTKVRYYTVTITNESEEAVEDLEVMVKVPPPSVLARVFAKSQVKGNRVQLGVLGPGESREGSFVTVTAMPKVELPVKLPISPKKPTVDVRYVARGGVREQTLKVNGVVLTEDRILMRYKLELDVGDEISSLSGDINAIRGAITAGKIKKPKVLYNVLLIENGSKEDMLDVEAFITAPKTLILVGKRAVSTPVVEAGGLWEARFITVQSELKILKLLGGVKVGVRYRMAGEEYAIGVGVGETAKMPRDVNIKVKAYDIRDRRTLLKAVYEEAKRLIK